jgi:hypothetical protein
MRIYFVLRLRYSITTSIAFYSPTTSYRVNTNLYPIIVTPLASELTACRRGKIGNSLCCVIRLRSSVNYAVISLILTSVLDSYRVSSSSRGISVRSTILDFISTRSRLYRTNLAPLKLAKILSFVIALLKAILKASRKVVFLT